MVLGGRSGLARQSISSRLSHRIATNHSAPLTDSLARSTCTHITTAPQRQQAYTLPQQVPYAPCRQPGRSVTRSNHHLLITACHTPDNSLAASMTSRSRKPKIDNKVDHVTNNSGTNFEAAAGQVHRLKPHNAYTRNAP